MNKDKKSNSGIIVIILAVLLIGAVGYTFYNNSEHKKLTDAIEEEKTEIGQNLDSMIVKYEDAIAENTALSNELSFERDRIVALRDSIKDLKVVNYSLIRKFRKQIDELEATNIRLFAMNDSLTSLNKVLNADLDTAKENITKQIAINDTLSSENVALSEKVAIGSILKVNKAKVITMRSRSNGKLVETSRARNTDAFRINFTIDKNEISEQGERNVFVQIVDVKGNVIAGKGEFELADASRLSYSDRTSVSYMNDEVDIISLVEVNREDMAKGLYTVNIFIEDKFAGTTQTTLK